eukprot:3177716-Amphidinium_carterae.1
MTYRAYHKIVQEAIGFIARERAASRAMGIPHIMDNVDMEKLGTHTFKKSTVTILHENGASFTLLS